MAGPSRPADPAAVAAPRHAPARATCFRVACFLLACAAAARAVDVPQGEVPKIDGRVEDAEWGGAARLAAGDGEALLLVSGRVLCIGIRVSRPYGGERIDLQVADETGNTYASHAFHPACTIPPLSPYPLAPVFVRRASYAMRQDAPLAPPVSCRYRARVYNDAASWSAEIAIALEALEVSPLAPIVFMLDVVHPAGEARPIAFAPPRGDTPRQWERLVASWPASAPAFLTPEEDRCRAFELALSLETLAMVMQKPPDSTPMADAVQGKKSTAKIDELLARLDDCVTSDALDLFALATRASLLRRANRLEAAWKAEEPLWALEPARKSLLVAGLRRMLLISDMRFEEAARMDLPGSEGVRAMASAWRKETEAREKDSSLPRVAFATTRGRVVVELFERDAPKSVARVLARVEKGDCAGITFDTVAGAAFAQALPRSAESAEAEGGRHAWRGTLALAESGALRFHTGHDSGAAVGRVVEGMDAVDAIDAGDRIESAEILGRPER